MKWTGLDKRYSFDYTGAAGAVTWDYKTTSHPFRCIYYPIDPTYTAPTACNGGCFDASPPVGPARLVFDKLDHPAATIADDINTCRQLGAHLPSERDYTEAIRAGVPGGSGANVLTSDIGIGSGAVGNPIVVHWVASEPTFTDQYVASATWISPITPGPFRCMWTNELGAAAFRSTVSDFDQLRAVTSVASFEPRSAPQ